MSNTPHHLLLWTRVRKPIASVLLAAYLISALIAASPPSALRKLYTELVGTKLNRLGLFSNFGVFAADPEDFNQEFEAQVKFADGSTKIWILPHLSQWKDRPAEIEKKFFWSEWQIYFMAIPSPAREALWQDAARYAAWLYRNPVNQPVSITIYRKYSMIIPFADSSSAGAEEPVQTAILITYTVKPGDLR